MKWEQPCLKQGAEVCLWRLTFHVVIASDSFYSKQIVFRWLMGLSWSNLGSDEFCFRLETKICLELLTSLGVIVCLMMMMMIVVILLLLFCGSFACMFMQ